MRAGVWIGLAALWVGLSLLLFFASSHDWDLRVADYFYDGRASNPWPQGEGTWTTIVERWGRWPCVLVVVAAVGLAVRRRAAGDPRWRLPASLALLIALGPGAVVHGLKSTWGRERPRDVFHWKRPVPHQEWWQAQGPQGGPSFPSGHAASAAVLIAVAAIGLRARPRWAVLATAAATALAVAVSWARIADGAHYFCDVVAAWLLVLSTVLALAPLWSQPPPAA